MKFSDRFEIAWREPTAQKLVDLLAEDVVLYQPHVPPIIGKEAAYSEFERLLSWVPGIYSETINSQEDENIALIEHILHFPVKNGFIRLPSVDRFVLKDGLAKERVVYFDQMRLLSGLSRNPSMWRGFIRYRLSR